MYSGDDALTPEFAKLGGKGLISVASNAWPKATNLFLKKCVEQSLDEAETALWTQACNALFSASNPIPVKCLMHAVGTITSDKLQAPLTAADMKKLDELKDYDQKIKEWLKRQ